MRKHVKKKSPAPHKAVSLEQLLKKGSATALELLPFTHLDDAALRRLGNINAINPATKRPWIPKPARGVYDVATTLAGALAWWNHQANRSAEDHPVYADMEEAEKRGLIPREFQKYAKSKGIDFINLNRSIKSEPLRRLAAEFLSNISSLEAIEGVEGLNPDAELAKLRREQRREKARQNAEADGVVHNKARIEELLWENCLAPLRAGLLSLRKTAFAQVDAELEKADVPEAARAVVKSILVGSVETLLAQIRQCFPERLEKP